MVLYGTGLSVQGMDLNLIWRREGWTKTDLKDRVCIRAMGLNLMPGYIGTQRGRGEYGRLGDTKSHMYVWCGMVTMYIGSYTVLKSSVHMFFKIGWRQLIYIYIYYFLLFLVSTP